MTEVLCHSFVDSESEYDQRNDLEIPATDLTFVCPERAWVKDNLDKKIYVYQVRTKSKDFLFVTSQ